MLAPDSDLDAVAAGGPKKMIGSVLFIRGNSLEEVTKRVKEDIYYKSGVVSPSVTGTKMYKIVLTSSRLFDSGILRSWSSFLMSKRYRNPGRIRTDGGLASCYKKACMRKRNDEQPEE